MGKLLKITLVGIVIAFITERIVRLSGRLHFYLEVQQIHLPHCQLLKGIEFGSEDIDILPNGLAFISSGLKYPGLISFAPEKPGEIFLLDLNDEELRPISLRFSRDFELASFNPHGISTYIEEKDDTVYLFVVNHPHYKSTVEIFKFLEEDNVLMHLKTIKHALLQRYVYVADSMDHKIHVLEKHANWSLTPVKELEVEAGLDNLSVDPHTGDIWTGAHPYLWKLFHYNKENLPWSEVIRIQNILSDDPIVTQVYVNNGSVIQGSSSASVFEGKLLVGTVFHKALYCELD
ncbi:serum paraoxonase/arylesterase 2 isoform X2 [Bombina bombina]|uniref:serum paraoxonase/arylesterase 2 isoform X2 n=1 Tax=Bombina bombina TaxID=8345 RepID=UPI00235AD7BB|nr:serum paraoxonase/arylesterase 2 isoform X2 [Bombina bombina]